MAKIFTKLGDFMGFTIPAVLAAFIAIAIYARVPQVKNIIG